MPSKSTLLKGLANIGPTIAARLEAVGISTVGDLKLVGVARAYTLVKVNNPGKATPVCYYLYSLQGALDGVHWNALSKQKKQELLNQVDEAKALTIHSSRTRFAGRLNSGVRPRAQGCCVAGIQGLC